MDFHVLIVIACAFLASACSLLFINKFFRGKTFEEVAAEKRLLAEKLYGNKSKRSGSNQKKSNNNSANAARPNKRKNSNPKSSGTGILINKSESSLVKENLTAEPLNTFEIIHPKDAVEMKRQAKEETPEAPKSQKPAAKDSNKKPKQVKKEAVVEKVESSVTIQQEQIVAVAKETRQPDEKQAKQIDSPKTQNKPKPKKKPENPQQQPAARKELPVPTVNSLMSALGRAEFTRGEIQILIDYLLNKQQDTVANHSEWSDDIVQKLRKKLEEKEKAFEEEQNASAGIQAKLRELRATINTERAQNNANIKAYIEEIQSQKLEIQNLTQDMNDKIEKLKEQYNMLKMQRASQEEHFNPQILFNQIEKLNQTSDMVKRNALVGQIVEILQPQNDENLQLKNEIIALRNEIMLLSNDKNALIINLSEAEKKILCQNHEQEDKANMQQQIGNLKAALDAANLMLSNKQNHVHSLTTQIDELNRQLAVVNEKYVEQANNSHELRSILSTYETTVQEKDDKLAEYEANIRNLISKENELQKQIYEQKEKNNQPLVDSPQSQEDRLRDLLQRLFPEAVATSAGSALSLSFDQWVEQVISSHTSEIVKDYQSKINKQAEQLKQIELNNVVNKSNNDHYSTSNHTESINNHKEHSNNGNSNDDIILQNAQLRAQVAELKSVVINTENTLKNLELQALEQDSKWRNVVSVKQEEIDMLKNSNRQTV